MLKLFFILFLVKYSCSTKKHEHHNIAERLNSNANQLESTKNIFILIDRITQIGIKNTCDNKIIETDVQNEIKSKIKSIISTCDSYCRLAMSPEGRIYGAKDFILDTFYTEIDVPDKQGAHYIKFTLSNKYLCTEVDGKLFASEKHSNGCLWFYNSSISKFTSAYYNIKLVLEKNCNIVGHQDDNRHHNQDCTNKFNISKGFSQELKNFFSTCTDKLISGKNNEPISHTTQSTHFKLIQPFMHQTKIAQQPTKLPLITKKTFEDEPLNRDFLSLTVIMIEKAEKLCTQYLRDELIYEKLTNFDYLNEPKLAKIPAMCIDYFKYLKYQKKIKNEEKNQVEYNFNYDNNESKTNKFKKCYQYRNTAYYKECMEKYYKCHTYNNNAEELRKCRKKYGIKMPKKNPAF